jgi:hypothetical protein
MLCRTTKSAVDYFDAKISYQDVRDRVGKTRLYDLTFPIVIVIFYLMKMMCATKMLILAKFLVAERYKNDQICLGEYTEK